MKKSILFLFAVLIAFSSSAQEKYFELYGSASLNNAYLIGAPIQKWMNDDIRSGSPAFFNIGGTSFLPLNSQGTMHLGVDFAMYIPPSHSIWGSNLYFGGRNELVLNPYMLSLGMPLRLGFGNSGLSMTFDPSMLMNVLSGKYSTNGTINVDGKSLTGTFNTSTGSMGIGFGMSIGAELHMGIIGIGVKYGARILRSAVYFNNNNGGSWSPVDSNGDEIKLDLGGSYLTVGMMLKFAKRNAGE
jgi:hypothetical protein